MRRPPISEVGAFVRMYLPRRVFADIVDVWFCSFFRFEDKGFVFLQQLGDVTVGVIEIAEDAGM